MGNRLLNEYFIRQRSAELQIPFENLLAASVLEEIVQRISESEFAEGFWLKSSAGLNLENYKKKVHRNLFYFMKDMQKLHYKKTEISNVFAIIFRNLKKEAICWNYNIRKEREKICANLTATMASIKVPVKITFEQITDNNLKPCVREIRLFTNNNQKIRLNCFPNEYIIVDKFLNIIEKLELLNDLSSYMDIYDILKKEMISGRKVWELLNESCAQRGIKIEQQRFDMLISYRTNSYMKKKWKAYLRHEKATSPSWDEIIDIVEAFFSNIWLSMCQNMIYLGDWMPELRRFID